MKMADKAQPANKLEPISPTLAFETHFIFNCTNQLFKEVSSEKSIL